MNHPDYIGRPDWDKQTEYMKSKARCEAGHPVYIIKRLFGCRKAVYRGLAKNHTRLYMLFRSANPLRWSWSRAAGGPLAPA
jgi:IS5 family transposase